MSDQIRDSVIYNIPNNTQNFFDKITRIQEEFTTSTPSQLILRLYQIDNQDGDKMIKAFQRYSYLKTRIEEIVKAQIALIQSKGDSVQKVNYFSEIRKTHFTPLKSHWVPFTATSKIYRSHESSGPTVLGSKIMFNINTTDTHLLSDGCIILKLKGMKANSATNKCKYATRLGERIVSKIEFKCNSITEQWYDSQGLNHYYNKILPTEKKIAWDRAISDNHKYTGILNENPDTTTDDVEQHITLNTGLDVYKNEHTEVEICVPLIFYWNNDKTPLPVRRYGNRKFQIELTLAQPDECRRIINYVDPDDSFPSNQTSYLREPTIEAKLYLAHITGTDDIESAIYEATEAQMVRYLKQTRITANTQEGNIRLTGIGGFIERLIIGFKPHTNASSTTEISYNNWYKCSKITSAYFETPTYNGSGIEYIPVIYQSEDSCIDTYQLKLKGSDLTYELPIKLEDHKAIFQHHTSHSNESKYLVDLDFRVGYDDSNSFQPTGYIHAPSGNDLSISYTGTNITPSAPVFLEVLAVCLGYVIFDPQSQQMTLKYIL